MQPGGGEHGRTAQDHPPAAVRLDDDASPHSAPPLPAIVPAASEQKKKQQLAESLPEGPLVEILARVPYKSLCRFKCVSKPWLALCSSRDILKRSPQTLSGFFYHKRNYDGDGHHHDTLSFRNLSGRGLPQIHPSLHFLHESYGEISLDQVCGGLLLCSCWKSWFKLGEPDYVVCNPATEEWNVLPPIIFPAEEVSHLSRNFKPVLYLGFDAAVPSRFVVFAPLTDSRKDSGNVAIYSSETGQWTYVRSNWASGTRVDHARTRLVVLNDTIHLTTFRSNSIVTVDTEGKVWREIKMPDLPSNTDSVSIGQSQGRLYAWQIDDSPDCRLYIWVLEDYGTGKWTLQHTVNLLELFGRNCLIRCSSYSMFAVHPDCNVIFLCGWIEKKTVSYDLDNQEVDVICDEFMDGLPYVPYFGELPPAGQ